MQLKPEILAVLNTLGATDPELTSLTNYFADRLTAAEATVLQLQANAESIQTQIGEAQAHAEAIRAAIGKFVVTDA
ncbi:hypothetical protein RFN29_30615 [Mesorhizobium sp. VK22B]|uniref:Uncharacterized protein n=1 Tax=Mesorhizobium captivum TaxID=3072319 RepID=A0ABU4Z9K9_9HYPH|nr:hypothetical protein [Mesorhizobium sp. VK22B]MDX8495900.1 hypothetical protein [Mesorhizobium sp. VK22B]